MILQKTSHVLALARVVFDDVANEHVGIETYQRCRSGSEMARSMSSSVTVGPSYFR